MSALNKLWGRGGDTPSGLEQIMEALTGLHGDMRNIQEAPDRGKAALAAARARMGLQGADPIFTLERLAANQPAPLDRMLSKLANESWRVILNNAVAQLERQWYQEVYQPFQQTLARHYPFDPGAGRDAALQDFERFFAPDGVWTVSTRKPSSCSWKTIRSMSAIPAGQAWYAGMCGRRWPRPRKSAVPTSPGVVPWTWSLPWSP